MNTFDINATGTKVWATSPEDHGEPYLRFENDPLIALPVSAQDVRVSPDGRQALVYGQNGQGYRVGRDSWQTPIGPVYCPEAIAWSPSGEAVWIDSPTTYRVDGVAMPLPAHRMGTTGGILEVTSSGVTWMDDLFSMPAFHRTFAGVEFVTFRRLGAWVFGNSQIGSVAVNLTTGQVFSLARMNRTSRTLRGALEDGRLTVVSSRPAVLIREQDFEPYVAPEPVYAPVVAIGRPLWMGSFEFAGDAGFPSNCRIHVVQGAKWLEVQGPDWRYVAGSPDGDINSLRGAIGVAASETNLTVRPVVAYVPRSIQAHLPTHADVQGIEAYLGADETDAQFLKRISTSIRVSPRAVLIANCYTSNTTLTSDLRRVPGLISQLARDHANVEGILVFSGSGRATGWQEHPEVHDDWRKVFAGITGVPVITPPVIPSEPAEPEPVQPEPPFISNEQPPSTERPTMTQPEFTRPEPFRPEKPVGGNAVADFFRALGKINFRKVFKRWFR